MAQPAAAPRSAYLRPALAWALLHIPVYLALYASPIAAAVRSTPAHWRAWLVPTFLPQAALLSLAAWAIGLPFALAPKVYRFAAPAMAAAFTVLVALDSRVYGALGYHLNGFFLQLILQPHALREAGVPVSDLALFSSIAGVFVALDIWAGARFLRRFAGAQRTWTWVLALVLLAATERVYGGTMVYFGGASFFSASTVLPMQVPIRIGGTVQKLLGKPGADMVARDSAATHLPDGISASEVQLTRKPDVIFLVTESLPSEHLDAKTMPNLWRRGLEGARFPNHYAGACSTHYTIFTLLYGIQAQKLEETVGSGRQPLLFPALAANGYAMRVLCASCIDWMGLKDTVFGGVHDVLETWCAGHDPRTADEEMMASAERFVSATPRDQPVFLFLFFFGTHFNYFYEPQDRVFTPDWDGSGGLKASAEPGWKIENRARNSARTLDRRIESFLSWFEARRGSAPLVFFTGDHGEEFRQKGHIGHGSDVTREQVNVPALWFGPGVPKGVFDTPTSHADVVPTLFSLLGDHHPPSRYADGEPMFTASPDRFVVTTVGWEPLYAAIGRELKVKMYAGLGAASVTDPDDRPLPDGAARLARNANRIMRAMRGEPEPAAPGPAPLSPGEPPRAAAP